MAIGWALASASAGPEKDGSGSWVKNNWTCDGAAATVEPTAVRGVVEKAWACAASANSIVARRAIYQSRLQGRLQQRPPVCRREAIIDIDVELDYPAVTVAGVVRRWDDCLRANLEIGLPG